MTGARRPADSPTEIGVLLRGVAGYGACLALGLLCQAPDDVHALFWPEVGALSAWLAAHRRRRWPAITALSALVSLGIPALISGSPVSGAEPLRWLVGTSCAMSLVPAVAPRRAGDVATTPGAFQVAVLVTLVAMLATTLGGPSGRVALQVGQALFGGLALAPLLSWLVAPHSAHGTPPQLAFGVALVAVGASVVAGNDSGLPVRLLLLAGVASAYALVREVTSRRAQLAALKSHRLAIARFARAQESFEEEIRHRIAGDLHDGIAQLLAGQRLLLGAALAATADDRLQLMLAQASQASDEAQGMVREIIQDLKPPDVALRSVPAALSWISHLFKTRYVFRVVWSERDTSEVGDPLKLFVYRVVCELLFNAYKHSHRDWAEVDVVVSDGQLSISVIDEGIGFAQRTDEMSDDARFGLAQITQRALALGGSCDIASEPGEGTHVTVRVPCPDVARPGDLT